ncbi:hypothetical protein X801_07647, partial [Opisthorchis viverrini]
MKFTDMRKFNHDCDKLDPIGEHKPTCPLMDSQSELTNLDNDVLRNESARVSSEMKATLLSSWSTEYFLIRISHCCAAALLVRTGYKQNASNRIVLGLDDFRNILKISHENILLPISWSTLHCEHSQGGPILDIQNATFIARNLHGLCQISLEEKSRELTGHSTDKYQPHEFTR